MLSSSWFVTSASFFEFLFMASAFVLCKSHTLKYIFDSPDDSALFAADLRNLIIRTMSVMFVIYLSEPNQRFTFKEPCGWYKAFDG